MYIYAYFIAHRRWDSGWKSTASAASAAASAAKWSVCRFKRAGANYFFVILFLLDTNSIERLKHKLN